MGCWGQQLAPSLQAQGLTGALSLLNDTVQEEQFLDLQLPFNSMIYNLMSCGPILSMYKLSELPRHYQKCPLHLNNCHCALFAPLPPWLSIFSTLSLLAGTHTDRFWQEGCKMLSFYRTYDEHQNGINPFPSILINCNNWRFKAISLERQTKKLVSVQDNILCRH